MRNINLFLLILFTGMSLEVSLCGAQDSAGDLAKAAQNPVANMISLPLQNNTYFGIGPDDDKTANVLNIQPVIPVNFGKWNLINRIIAPVIYLPDLTNGIAELPNQQDTGSEFGLGDVNYSGFLSPAKPGKIIWGIGPAISVPTATDDQLGSGKWSAGPTAVVLTSEGPWLLGALARNIWSFAGDSDREDVNQFLLQPFINYNMANGWYLTTSPIITANWERNSDDRWLLPIGGGVGRIFHIGKQAMNAQVQGFYNIETPQFGPDWTLRFQLQFLFPKKKQSN
jgi:hypothetical protein